jgi:hypothetical protein
MPRATIGTETEKFFLRSLDDPNDPGWIELRRLPYGMVLERRDMAAKMAVEGLGERNVKDMKVTTELIQAEVTAYEFRHCIVDHNLEDENGRKLNLGTKQDITKLDPRVGAEIAQLIDDFNDWEADLRGKEDKISEAESEPVLS